MDRRKIKAGKTYKGKDGKIRKLEHILYTLNPPCVIYKEYNAQGEHKENCAGPTLNQFAQWATKEVKV